MSLRDERQRGFTLLELLVVIGILGLLIGLMVPGLSSARRQAKRTHCLANLHTLALAVGAYAADDRHSQLIPAHPIADTNPLHDEGFFDYGGNTGAVNVWEGLRFGPGSKRTAETRPLNAVLFKDAVADDAAFEVFRCPGDEGIPSGAHTNNPRFWDPAMPNQPMSVSVGTSYGANAYRARGSIDGRRAERYYSIGPFLRSSGTIPHPSVTVILYEAVMWYNSQVESRTGPVAWQGLPGWHGGRPEYNATFADGHTETADAPLNDLWVGTDAEYSKLHLRSRKFRFDCFPAPPIEDLPAEIEPW